MGLLDILNGMQNGPRGQRQPANRGSGGGMSPIMMALLGLLAYKALKGHGQAAGAEQPASRPTPVPPDTRTAGNPSGGGLADILGGLFGARAGGVPGGAAPGGNLGD